MIKSFSQLHKAEQDYTKVSNFLKIGKSLCLNSSFPEFKEEMGKWRKNWNLRLSTFLGANDPENEKVQFYMYCFYGLDSLRKWDWILSEVKVLQVEMWLDAKNPAIPSETFQDVVLRNEDLTTIFEKHGFVFTAMRGRGYKQDTFEWNGFSVLNAGFQYENMKRVLQELQPVVEKIKRMGFEKVFYNPIVFVSNPLEGQVYNESQKEYKNLSAGAYYSYTKDIVVMKANQWNSSYKYENTFAHELAHRLYYKFLSPTQRQRWTSHFHNRIKKISPQDIAGLKKLVISCCPVIHDPMRNEEFPDFSRFNYRKFTNKLRQNSEMKEALDFILQAPGKAGNIKTLRREYFKKIFDPQASWGLGWFGKYLPLLIETLETKEENEKAFAVSRYALPKPGRVEFYKSQGLNPKFANVEALYEEAVSAMKNWNNYWDSFVNKTIKLPHSTTEYGENNPSEDFAEAFAAFVMNQEMPQDIYREFVNILQIRLGKKASVNLDMFVRGYCAEFALALHEKTGFPIVSFEEEDFDGYTMSIHYAVKDPSGKIIDARGLRTQDEIIDNLYKTDGTPATPEEIKIRELSVNDLEAETEINEEAFEIAVNYLNKNKKV